MRNVKFSPQYCERSFLACNDNQTHARRDWRGNMENKNNSSANIRILAKTSDIRYLKTSVQIWCQNIRNGNTDIDLCAT